MSPKYNYSASVAADLSGKRVSVPALPYRGNWAVIRQPQGLETITHVITGARIMYSPGKRLGRVICSILDALPYDFSTKEGQQAFKASEWWPWLLEWR